MPESEKPEVLEKCATGHKEAASQEIPGSHIAGVGIHSTLSITNHLLTDMSELGELTLVLEPYPEVLRDYCSEITLYAQRSLLMDSGEPYRILGLELEPAVCKASVLPPPTIVSLLPQERADF